jgi:hypothetical protein
MSTKSIKSEPLTNKSARTITPKPEQLAIVKYEKPEQIEKPEHIDNFEVNCSKCSKVISFKNYEDIRKLSKEDQHFVSIGLEKGVWTLEQKIKTHKQKTKTHNQKINELNSSLKYLLNIQKMQIKEQQLEHNHTQNNCQSKSELKLHATIKNTEPKPEIKERTEEEIRERFFQKRMYMLYGPGYQE